MRTSRTKEDILTLLDEYAKSNMKVKEFCKLVDISTATFHNWRNKYHGKLNSKEGSGFASLRIMETVAAGNRKLFARVGNVEIYAFVEAAYLKQLMS